MTNQKIRLVLCLLLGLLLALQYEAVNSGHKYLSIKEMYAYSGELEASRSEIEQMKLKKIALQSEIDAFTLAKEDERVDYEALLRSEIEWTKKIAGLTPVEGPGVIVIITDGFRDLSENEDPNNVLVHDLDIRSVVDDLRNAGAEAIAINNQRVLFNKSKIICTGPTIQINDQVFAPPYVIQAIGDKDFLQSAINAPDSFSHNLRQWGVFVEVNTSVHLKLPAYESFFN